MPRRITVGVPVYKGVGQVGKALACLQEQTFRDFEVIISVDDKVKKGVFDGFVLVSTTDPAKKEIKIPLKGVIL